MSPAVRDPDEQHHTPGGLVIFLNGTSSSGKSSIAVELLRILDEPYFHIPVDAFHAMRTRQKVRPTEMKSRIPAGLTTRGCISRARHCPPAR